QDISGIAVNAANIATNATDIATNVAAIAAHNTADGDLSATNEIQDLQFSGGIITLSNDPDATTIDLSGYDDNAADDFDGGWTSLSNRPTGLDDGDDDTQYTAGTGLTLSGTEFSISDLAGDVTGPTNATVIADDAITTAKILDGAIIGGPGGKIADNSITASDLAPNSVNASEINADAVGTSELKVDAVETENILDGSVTPIKIEPGNSNQVLVTNSSGDVAWEDQTTNADTPGGALIRGIASTTSDYTLGPNDYTLIVYGNNDTISFPSTAVTGQIYVLKIMQNAKKNETNINYIDEEGDRENELKEKHTYTFQFDGTYWQLINKSQ
ncbi:hypothetical protein PHU20_17310, partial [Maribacter sp. D37]|nr:hypothetical protein [Maribacter polysaccharolyticus]